MAKVLYKEAKEVLGNAMDYTRSLVANVRDDIRCVDEGHDELERRLNIIGNKVDNIERQLELPIQGDREQDYLHYPESPPIKEVIKDYGKSISPYSKTEMQGILNRCRTEDADSITITIYKRGIRTEGYDYEKK